MAYSTMNTVPAADVEAETPLLQRDSKINAKTLVGGAAAAAFVLGMLAATAVTSQALAAPAQFNVHKDYGKIFYPMGDGEYANLALYDSDISWCLDVKGDKP